MKGRKIEEKETGGVDRGENEKIEGHQELEEMLRRMTEKQKGDTR